MLISVLNIKLTCKWHKANKLNYKNIRIHVIVVLWDPSTCVPRGDVTRLIAHSVISLVHNCTKIIQPTQLISHVSSVMWGSPIMLEVHLAPYNNGISSNKPGNSIRRQTSYAFPVKLLSKTKDPINLLPSTPHHKFTVNLLWKLVTLVSCGISWDHVYTFRKLFTPSRIKDASQLNKMTPNSSGWAFSQWHKSIRWAWSLGYRCCTLWSW